MRKNALKPGWKDGSMQLFLLPLILLHCLTAAAVEDDALLFVQADRNAAVFHEMAGRMHRMMNGWLARADPKTKLIPNRLPGGRPGRGLEAGDDSRIYEPHNSGADLYPYLILTASLTSPDLLQGVLLEMLRNELKYTTVQRSIPAEALDLNTGKLSAPSIFAGAEYAKDGLVPVLEYLGRTPWSDRMEQLAADIMEEAPVRSRFGNLPASDSEVNGNLLQVLVRLGASTGDARYIEWARRIGDAYVGEVLPGNNGLPATNWDFQMHTGDGQCRLRNHGNEVVTGLSLLFAYESERNTDRARRYRTVLQRMFDRILESANADGMLYNNIDSRTLQPTGELGDQLADTWGYIYCAVYAFYQATGEEKYRQSVRHVLGNLHKYTEVDWGDRGSVNGYTDTIESAIYLLSREPVPEAFAWVDSQIPVMIQAQRPTGLVEHWYGDGNFNRTLQLYILQKSQGVRPDRWIPGFGIGAVRKGNRLLLSIQTEGLAAPWNGRVKFDFRRHRELMNFGQNYARLNEFPEWYVVEPAWLYRIRQAVSNDSQVFLGAELIQGIVLSSGHWVVESLGPPPYAAGLPEKGDVK